MILVLVVAVVVGATAFVLRVRAVTYRATAELVVTPVPAGQTALLGLPLIQESSDPTLTIQTAAGEVRSRQVAKVTATQLPGPWTTDQVLRSVAVTPQGQTNILEIQGSAHTPTLAADLANAYANSVISVRDTSLDQLVTTAIAQTEKQLASLSAQSAATGVLEQQLTQLQLIKQVGDPTISILQPAAAPTSPHGPSELLVLLLAALGGLVIGSGAAILVDRRGPRRIRTEADLLHVWPLEILARTRLPRRVDPPGPGRPASSQPVFLGTVSLELPLLCAEQRDHIAQERSPGQRVVSVISATARDGRTLVARALASDLAGAGHTVALVGLDDGMPLATMETADEAYVIVDTAALSERPSVALAVKEADVALLVVRLGHTLEADLAEGRRLLNRVGRSPAGAVLIERKARRKSAKSRVRRQSPAAQQVTRVGRGQTEAPELVSVDQPDPLRKVVWVDGGA